MNETCYNLLLKLLYESVTAEGGDGDAIWLSNYTPIEKIIPWINKFNIDHQTGWRIEQSDSQTFNWGTNQEWVTVTSNRGVFESDPWSVLKIEY